MRAMLVTLALAAALVVAGCTTAPLMGAASPTDQIVRGSDTVYGNLGSLSSDTSTLANYVANRSIQDALLAKQSTDVHRSANEMSSSMSRSSLSSDATETAIRAYVQELQALSAGQQVRSGRRTSEEVLDELERLRAEVERLNRP